MFHLSVGRRSHKRLFLLSRGTRIYINISRNYPRPRCVICPVVIHKDITTPIKAPDRFLRGTLNDHSRALSPQCKLRPSVNLVLNRC